MKYIATLFALLSASLICAHAARMRGKNTKLVQRTEGSFEDKAYNSFCEYESQEDKKACKQSFCGVDGNADLTNEASRSDTNPVDIEDVDSLRLKLRNCGAPCVSSSGSIIKNMGPVPYYGCAEKDGFEDESSRVDCLRRRFNAHCGNITITQNALNDCGVTYNECSSKEHAGDELRCLRRIYNTKCLFCFIQEYQGYTPDDCKFHQSHDQFCHNLNCRGTEVANFDFKNCAKYKSIPTAFCDDFPQEKMKLCNEFAYLIGYEAGGVPPPMGSSDATSHGHDTFYGDSTGDNEQMKKFTALIKTALRWKSCRYPENCDAQCLQRKYLICADQNIRIHALEAHNYPALYYSDAYPQ
jgi:hypothetical protein